MAKRPEVRFYLEKRKDKKSNELITTNVPIFLFFSYDGQRFQYYTGCRVDMKKWDYENQKVKRNYSETQDINLELDKLRTKVLDVYGRAKALNLRITPAVLREQLNAGGQLLDLLKPQQEAQEGATKMKQEAKKDFKECLADYYEFLDINRKEETIRAIKDSFKKVEAFSETSGIQLSFENITMDFYNQFLSYCFKVRKYKNGYTGKIIKDLKAFLNYANEEGHNTNVIFKKKAFKKLTEENEIIFLTYEELMNLYNAEITSKRLERVRDVFCFGCFTGMRYSDIKRLGPENVFEDKIIYRVVKTEEPNVIPLNPYSKAILEKYKGKYLKSLPVVHSSQINEDVKTLAKEVKLERMVQKVNYRGAKRIEKISLYTTQLPFT